VSEWVGLGRAAEVDWDVPGGIEEYATNSSGGGDAAGVRRPVGTGTAGGGAGCEYGLAPEGAAWCAEAGGWKDWGGDKGGVENLTAPSRAVGWDAKGSDIGYDRTDVIEIEGRVAVAVAVAVACRTGGVSTR
jgi:hypothetical protein